MLWNTLSRTWGPWQELQRIQSDMSRLLSGIPAQGLPTEYPPINVYAGEDGLKLVAELPGLDPSDIDVSVVQDTLTLKGGLAPEEPEKAEMHRRERRTGRFVRSVQLPYEIESDEVEARFRNGVLEVDLPRARAARPRRIAVKNT
jgi:HSP20 family protein